MWNHIDIGANESVVCADHMKSAKKSPYTLLNLCRKCKGYKPIRKTSWCYPNLKSSKPVTQHSEDLPVPKFPALSNVHWDNVEISDTQSNSASESNFEGFKSYQEYFIGLESKIFFFHTLLGRMISHIAGIFLSF